MTTANKPQNRAFTATGDLGVRWPGRAQAFGCVVLGLIMTGPAAAGEQGSSRDAQALRRACATGALTPYVCALRGIRTPGEPGAQAKPAAVSAPTPAAKPAAEAATSPDAAPPARPLAGGKPFADAKGRFSLDIPAGWTVRQQGSEPSFAHGDDWIALRVMPSLPPKLAATAGLNLLKAQYASFHVAAEAQAVVGARRGYKTSVDAVTSAGRNAAITVLTAPISHADNLVVLAGGVPEHAAAIAAAVNAIVATLRFSGSAPGA